MKYWQDHLKLMMYSSAIWWEIAGQTCVGAYQAKGSESQAASYINLANPGTYDLTLGTAPTWNTNSGWGFTLAGGHYLRTGITPAVSGWSMFVQFSGVSGGWPMCGTYESDTMRFLLDARIGDNHMYANGKAAVVAGQISSGNMGFAATSAYLNGSPDGTLTGTASSPTIPIYIGRANGYAASASLTIVAVAIYSSTLSASDVSLLASNMAAL